MAPPEYVTLKSREDVSIKVETKILEKSVLLYDMFNDVDETHAAEEVPIPNVSEAVLRKVLEWLEHHRNDPKEYDPPIADESRKHTSDIGEWDSKFINVDQEMLFEIILAANYLDIKALLDLGCKSVANMIKGKNPEEIRKLFNIHNDFTPEEEAQIKRENEWAEDH